MKDKLIIRKTTESDIPVVLDLYRQIDVNDRHTLSVEEATKILAKFQIYPNYSLYLAEIDNKIVGTFELLIMDNFAHGGSKSGIVEDVVIDRNYRSKGLGRKMMEYAMAVCKDNNCYKLTLSSNIHRDKAHTFYENLGFTKHGYSFLIEL